MRKEMKINVVTLCSGYDSQALAPERIKRDFPDLATPDILSGVFNHTIGAPDMSVFDEIIFLSDYIEQTRSYESSVKLREYVLNNMKAENPLQNVEILHRACVIAIDNTVLHLINEKKAKSVNNERDSAYNQID
jgi:HD superfamily phosphohydrolase YqeK